MYQTISTYIKIYQNMSKYVKIYQNISKYIKQIAKNRKIPENRPKKLKKRRKKKKFRTGKGNRGLSKKQKK